MNRFIDLRGQRFGRLLVLLYVGNTMLRSAKWLCKCDCGNEKIINGYSLRNGDTKSCGCLQKEKLVQRTKINAKFRKGCWQKKEDDILKQFYPDNGPEYCFKLLDRTKKAVMGRVRKLDLKVKYAFNTGLPKKIIIKKLSNNRVISRCETHGETEHYYYNNKKIASCMQCKRLNSNKWRKLPINNFAENLRSLIKHAFKKIHNKNGKLIQGRCFKNLDYTPIQLYNYLNNIQNLQNNKCPYCDVSYDKCKISIDHVIPLSTAKTTQEVIDLFDLKNLNLMCKNCNSQKWKHDYSLWSKTHVIK